MMKILAVIALVLISIPAISQTQEKTIGDFRELKVFDLIEVNLIHSDVNKVVIKGERTSSVKVINDNGVLKLRMELEERFDGSDTFVEVFYTNVDVLDVNEGAVIVTNEAIKQNKIELRSQEGGKIKIGLQVNYVEIKAVSGGIIEASGLAEEQKATLNSGGILEAKDLQTRTSEVSITAGGNADVHASQRVDAKVTAGGIINIYGNPKTINKKRIVGGEINLL